MEQQSDIKIFNKLFNEYYLKFIRFAVGYVKEMPVAEDLVSDAFSIYWENRGKMNPDANPPAYILTIIKNNCLNYLQHQKTRQRIEQELTEHAIWLLNTKINTLEACDPELIFSTEIQQIINNTLGTVKK